MDIEKTYLSQIYVYCNNIYIANFFYFNIYIDSINKGYSWKSVINTFKNL